MNPRRKGGTGATRQRSALSVDRGSGCGENSVRTTGARAMAVAQMLADAGLRANGRWKRGSVPEPSASPESGSKAWANAMQSAGQVIDA